MSGQRNVRVTKEMLAAGASVLSELLSAVDDESSPVSDETIQWIVDRIFLAMLDASPGSEHRR
jgi:hypothetical protein